VLAATACAVRDLDLAEESVQEAYEAALMSWSRDGVPNNPAAWLTTIAKRRALDALRRRATLRAKLPLLVDRDGDDDEVTAASPDVQSKEELDVPDERLRLIFLCCHPALAAESQVALTLRLICGESTADIARAFLVSESTMSARLTRAKRKIAAARIPMRVPHADELPERLRGVLGVIHLLFTMGHTALTGPSLMRPELVDESVHLCRVLHELMPDDREVRGLLALILASDARRVTRTGIDGELLSLAQQDRSRWDRSVIDEASRLLSGCESVAPCGPYALQAAIALEHARAKSYDDTDWSSILHLYDELWLAWPTPVVALNRAVATAMVRGPEPALEEVERLELEGTLSNYQYLFAIKADLLRRTNREKEAVTADARALELTENEAERAVLVARLVGRE
jgi:RNA polymerase sigma-70 factor (ECF subfamily)